MTLANSDYIMHIPTNSTFATWPQLFADLSGNPYTSGLWDTSTGIPQHRVVWRREGKWELRQLGNRTMPFCAYGGGVMSYPYSYSEIFSQLKEGRERFYYIFYDIDFGEQSILAVSDDLFDNQWKYYKLCDRADMGRRDLELWKSSSRLQMFFQRTKQGNHETPVPYEPQMIYVLDVEGL
jgi:hypothetical protein